MKDLLIPDNSSFDEACKKVTHLGIGAHQDDLEIMALHGILECYQKMESRFAGITCTDGSGSPREGVYAELSDEEMMHLRLKEQREAAFVGEYAFMAQLGYSSANIKKNRELLVEELDEFLLKMQPRVIYTHNLCDKHPTHLAVVMAVIEALRQLPLQHQPQELLGCEVWRSLDWMPDDEKVILDVSAHRELSKKLIRVFQSQIEGGKRYDEAALGRYHANATFSHFRAADQASMVSYAMDLTPLMNDKEIDVANYVLGFIERFRSEVERRLKRFFW